MPIAEFVDRAPGSATGVRVKKGGAMGLPIVGVDGGTSTGEGAAASAEGEDGIVIGATAAASMIALYLRSTFEPSTDILALESSWFLDLEFGGAVSAILLVLWEKARLSYRIRSPWPCPYLE